MHRGSSKAGRDTLPAADNLPLSASLTPDLLTIEVVIVRASRERHEQLTVALGSSVREAVRRVGLAPEGTAVLIDDVPVPLDLPIERPLRLVVLPTFSGG